MFRIVYYSYDYYFQDSVALSETEQPPDCVCLVLDGRVQAAHDGPLQGLQEGPAIPEEEL